MCKRTLCAVLVTAFLFCPFIFAFSYAGGMTTSGYTPVDTVREILSVDDEGSEAEEWTGFSSMYEPEYISEGIFNVSMPAAYDFIIDPQNYFGHGQIFSDEYLIENHGDTDISITITDFNIIFPNDSDYAALSAPFDFDSEDSRKAIYLELCFAVPGQSPVIISSAKHNGFPSIRLGDSGDDDSVCVVTITGSVNPNPAEEWQMGDVKISLSYRVETDEDYLDWNFYTVIEYEDIPEEEDELPEDEEPAEEIPEEENLQDTEEYAGEEDGDEYEDGDDEEDDTDGDDEDFTAEIAP